MDKSLNKKMKISFSTFHSLTKKVEAKGETVIMPDIKPAYISKFNSIRENQVILLMIADGNKWNYLAVTKLSVL